MSELRDRLGDSYKVTSMEHPDSADRPGVIRLVPTSALASDCELLDVSVELPDGDTLVFRVPRRSPTRRCLGSSSFSSAC